MKLKAGRISQKEGQIGGSSVQMLTIRVAMGASAIVAVAYIAIAIAVAVLVSSNLIADVDRRLNQVLDVTSSISPGGKPPCTANIINCTIVGCDYGFRCYNKSTPASLIR